MNDAPAVTQEPLLRTLAPALRELDKGVRRWQSAKHRQPLSAQIAVEQHLLTQDVSVHRRA